MRILLVHHNTNNTGDDAIVESTIDQMTHIFPNCEIVLESGNPELSRLKFPDIKIVERLFSVQNIKHTRKIYSIEFVLKNIPFLFKTTISVIVSQIFARLNLNLFSYPILTEYKKADIVLSMAGDSISEDYAWFFRFYEMWLLHTIGKPLILYAQSVGPFTGKRVAYAKKYLSMCKLILARDEETIKLLTGYGVKTEIHRTADVAIALKSVVNETTHEVIKRFNLDKDTVGLVLRTVKYTDVNDFAYSDYLNGMNQLVLHIKKGGQKPIFLASIPEDAATALEFAEKFLLHYEVVKLYQYMPSEVKTILSSLKMVISPRMHPIILSSTMDVPVIGLGKEFKMFDYLKIIGIQECFSPMIPFDVSKVINIYDSITVGYSSITETIKSRLPEAVMLSNKNARLVEDFIKNS